MSAWLRSFLKMLAFLSLVILRTGPASGASPQEQAQSPGQQPFKLGVSTHLVLVPAIVTDKHGVPVTGLTTADFEVKEDGSTQKIVHLDELTADAARIEAVAANPNTFTNQVATEHPKKLEIIALDSVNTPFASAREGARHLVEFLSKNVDANTLLALVVMHHNGIRVIHNFSSDPSVLVAAVKRAQLTLSSRDTSTLNATGEGAEADSEAQQITALLNGSDTGNVSTPQQLAAVAKAQRAQVDAARQAQEALITLEDFQQLALYFGGVPGRKSLIWASTGFPFAIGTAPQSNTTGTLFSDWERTFRMLTDANIAVYPVDIGGLLPGANAKNLQTASQAALGASSGGNVSSRSALLDGVDSGGFTDPGIARQSTMRQMADMTGGQAFYNSNDGAELFRRAGEDASHYYILAYYTRETGKNGWRKLSVKVARDGAKVRARSGFFFNNAATEPDVTRQAQEMMALVSDLSFSALPIRGSWEPAETAGNDRKVKFLLSVPAGVPFIDAENRNHLNFDFRAIVTDANGRVAGKIGQRLETNLAADEAEKIRTQGLDYLNEFTLPPGQYKAHFVVRDNLRGAMGSIVTSLRVE